MTQTSDDPIAAPPASDSGSDGAGIDPRTAAVPAGPGEAPEAGKHRRVKKPTTVRSLVEWVLVLGGALVVALLIRQFLFTTFYIPSPSMQPTLIGDPNPSGRHDRVVVNRLSYKFHSVHRGDIVVFSTPKTEKDQPITENGRKIKDLIKRVIGLPGETVSLRDGHVYVDGKRLSEPYLAPGTRTTAICPPLGPVYKVPKGDVLVMGDNRTNSEDGRCFGPIPKKTILGRAFIRIWPLTKITWL